MFWALNQYIYRKIGDLNELLMKKINFLKNIFGFHHIFFQQQQADALWHFAMDHERNSPALFISNSCVQK